MCGPRHRFAEKSFVIVANLYALSWFFETERETKCLTIKFQFLDELENSLK